jgi:hypothetical protein
LRATCSDSCACGDRNCCIVTFFQRVIAYAQRAGSTRRRKFAIRSVSGSETTPGRRPLQHHDVPTSFAIAGTSVIAVAPEPITTTLLAAVVEVLGPLLRMDDRAREALLVLELGRVAVR